MNLDGLTQRIRERFLGRTSDHEEVAIDHNRASLRAGGLQGRRGGIQFKDGKIHGQARGKFLSRGRRTAILVSHAPGWEQRLFTRIDRQSARSRRTIRRMRAEGRLSA